MGVRAALLQVESNPIIDRYDMRSERRTPEAEMPLSEEEREGGRCMYAKEETEGE